MNRLYWLPIVTVLISLPMIFGWVGPNGLYGFRTPHTMSSPEVWYKANRLAGLALAGAAIAAALLWRFFPMFSTRNGAGAPVIAFVVLQTLALVAVYLKIARL